jgi:hypothetical protein
MAFHPAQVVRKQDSNFLNDFVQKQNQDDYHDGRPLSAPNQNIDKARDNCLDLQTSPKGGIVRRGELVVHRGIANLTLF